jgi:quinol monooxygenase YgiN
MNRVIVRYKVKPDRAEENEALVRAVYDELGATEPSGLRYATFVLDDGVSFVHISEAEGEKNPLTETAAFKAFQKDIKERCEDPPVVSPLTEVGSYRFFGR